MPFIFQFLTYSFIIILSIFLSCSVIRKIVFCIEDLIYNRKFNIKKAKVIPLKVANTTNMDINNIAIEIPTFKVKVVY